MGRGFPPRLTWSSELGIQQPSSDVRRSVGVPPSLPWKAACDSGLPGQGVSAEDTEHEHMPGAATPALSPTVCKLINGGGRAFEAVETCWEPTGLCLESKCSASRQHLERIVVLHRS